MAETSGILTASCSSPAILVTFLHQIKNSSGIFSATETDAPESESMFPAPLPARSFPNHAGKPFPFPFLTGKSLHVSSFKTFDTGTGYYPSYGYNAVAGGSDESSIHRHESSRPGGGLSSWSGLTGFLLGIIPLSLIVASLAPAFVSVPVATAAAGRRRRDAAQSSSPQSGKVTLLMQRLLAAQRKYG